MKMLGKQILFCTTVFFILAATVMPVVGAADDGATEVVDRIVAVVNDEIILLSELEAALAPYEKMIQERDLREEVAQQMRYRAREDVLNELIDRRLTEQKAQALGITVEEADVDAAIEHMKKSLMYTDEELRQAIAREGYTMADYRKQIREQILQSRLLSVEVKSKTVVTQEEIEAYYQAHPEKYRAREQYHLRNIIMRPPEYGDEEDRQKILAQMEEIHRQLEEGASFAAMARKYSQSSFAEDGGDLGLFALKDLSETLQQVIEQTAAGEITPVIETGNGYQIFFVEEIVRQPAVAVEAVAEEIRENLYKEKLNQRFESWLRELREQSHIKIVM